MGFRAQTHQSEHCASVSRPAASVRPWLSALLALFLGIASTACTSIDSRVAGLLREKNYQDARALLEAAGVGELVVEELDEQSAKARRALADAVWSDFGERAIAEADGGRPRAAQALIAEGLGYCAWCEDLDGLGASNLALIRSIDALVEEWGTGSLACTASARELLKQLEPVANRLGDTPELNELRMSAWMFVVDHWAIVIRDAPSLPDKEAIIGLKRELAAHPSEGQHLEELVRWMEEAQRVVAQSCQRDAELPELLQLMAELSQASQERAATDSRESRQLRVVSAALSWRFDRWLDSIVPAMLERDDLDLGDLAGVERFYEAHEKSRRIRESLCLAHVARAYELGRGGPTSLLAWAHIHRADVLASAGQKPEVAAARRLVEAALGSTAWPDLAISVEIGPGIDPPLQKLVYWALRQQLESRSNGWTRWRWVDPSSAESAVMLEVEGAELVTPSFEDLKQRSSRYFSHFQKVPNPRKDVLRAQLAAQNFSVSSAESAYDWAVSSFNINPTQFALNEVNMARSRYNLAIDQYNLYVNLFNATPSTISEEVYLPYFFQEGEVAFGWRLDVAIQVDGQRMKHRASSVESDFVRIGTRREDERESYRRDDHIDIDTSPKAGLGHLIKTVFDVERQLDIAVAEVPRSWPVSLTAEEGRVLGWLLHPGGAKALARARTKMPGFVLAAMDDLKLKPPTRAPDPIAITPPLEEPPSASTAEALASWYEPIVCEIRVENSGSLLGHGSGVLISGDGLVLTCAHVLGGPQLTARIHDGEWSGDYVLELLFADQQSDVAVLRARGLTTTRWAPMRLDAPTRRGEALVAIGNPGLQGGGTSYVAVTEGIVSDPLTRRFDSEFLVADVNIRSGSSGGPLIALSDGAVIGVVQAVAPEGIPDNAEGGVASSGFTCLAAPSQALPVRLGLRQQ